ncbi:MAG: hypothetical protein JWM95_3326 [Gemmatimonadetes bacterium]|nr:hypothetical protein [Gemmatimonadota bacterium]
MWGNEMRKPTVLAVALAFSAAVPQRGSAQVLTGAPLPVVTPPPAAALAPADTPRSYPAAELDRIVSPIALYPDPLLAQVLSAAAYSQEIPQAQQWVDNHRGLSGPQLVDALAAERVAFDPSVQALVAFPTVLQMMANAIPWTAEIGDAFKTQHADVMDAVQRMRVQAQKYGYLQSNEHYRVTQAPAIEIVPMNPEYIVVPYYDPLVVYYAPRPHYLVSSAIYLGYGVRLGMWYDPWGWRSTGFYWTSHRVVASYPGWSRPWNYRPGPPIYHYPPVITHYGSRGDSRPHGTATPGGYVQPRTAHEETQTPERRLTQATEYTRPNPTPIPNARSAQPRQAEAQPQSAPREVREAPRAPAQQSQPRSGGERVARERGAKPR